MYKIIVLLLLVLSLRAESQYELGKGVQVASLPLYLGGYLSLDYRQIDEEKRYSIDDLALLGYGSYDKFSYMAEFEYKSLYVHTKSKDDCQIQKDTSLHTERLYLDYNYNDNYMLRAGKYNSPIGFWNLLPINVLKPTTSYPTTSNIIFPKFTTGLDISYSSYIENGLHIDLMAQNNDDFDNKYNNYKIDKHYGINLLYEKDAYSLKANAGYFHTIEEEILTSENLYYFLVSAKIDTETYELLSEIGYQQSADKITTPYAGFIQGLYRFTDQHIGIIRVESYEDKGNNESDEIAIFAYTYRPIYPIAVKSEYQFHSISAYNQFLFSLSVLF